jgi:hypothetical protein
MPETPRMPEISFPGRLKLTGCLKIYPRTPENLRMPEISILGSLKIPGYLIYLLQDA